MKIKEITVHAGRTFNHPFESYSNLRPSVSMTADISENEDPEEAIRTLQAKAEGLVEDHKQNMLSSLEEIHDLEMKNHEIKGLEEQLTRTQFRLDEIRKENPRLSDAVEETDDQI